MDYLGRPVWPFATDWSRSPAQSYQYDLADKVLGMADPRAQPVQSHTTRGIEFDLLLSGVTEIAAYDAWTAALLGRVNGFWVASPFADFTIVRQVNDFEVTIVKEAKERWWEDHPAIHVLLTKPGQADQAAQVEFVIDNNDGTETVQFSAPLAAGVDASWSARPLLYVRMAGDTEEAECLTTTLQRRRVKVVELPTAYAAIEIGTQPVWLYEFTMQTSGGAVVWRLTSLSEAIVSQGQTFASFPIRHTRQTRALRPEREELEIESWHDQAANPISRFIPFTLPSPLWVSAYQVTYAAPDTRTTLFSGRVLEVDADGALLTARCASAVDALGRKVPAQQLQSRCNWTLFSAPCGVSRSAWEATVTIGLLNGPYVSVSAPPGNANIPSAPAENLFQHGWLETGAGANTELRQIVRSGQVQSGQFQLSLNSPLSFAAVGQTATIRVGCDGTVATCKARFANFANWGGHVVVPGNLSVKSIDNPPQGGGKK
jgi:uncharacterized phage protein (TIGR02218 family)